MIDSFLHTDFLPKVCCVYTLYFPGSKKHYVGSAINLRSRVSKHLTSLRSNKSNCIRLQRAWNKYQEFWVFIWELCEVTQLRLREEYWIRKLYTTDPDLGYNISFNTIAPMQGRTHSEETKKLMALKAIGNKSNAGKVFSEEHKNKIKKALIGKNKGRDMGEQFGKKISERQKGSNNSFYGRTHSEETKQKIRDTIRNKALSKQ